MARNSKKTSRAAAAKKSTAARGRPAYVPTPEARNVVELMSAHGIPQDEIARAIIPPCDVKTLRKVFAPEIARARPRYKGQIAQAVTMWLMGRAAVYSDPVIVSGRVVEPAKLLREEVKPNIAMAIFQAKVVLGQREGQRLELTGKDGKPLFDPAVLRFLSETELEQLERILTKAARAAAVADPDDALAADAAGYAGRARTSLN
jgi:hypothetical protein